MIEELREKHKTVLRLIIAGTGSEIINELLEGHTAITIQTVVDVLEGILKNETDGYAVADNAQKALTEYKQLLNQTK